ncbi:MAG TPA: tetratricopeptide repeat protein [Terriglobales bacterium]|nr:tetratricopeptide repeat protein [Terriglobales bacterium]
MPASDSHRVFRFREFELDETAYELRRLGSPVKLERRLMELLILLVEHHRQLVTRTDIAKRLWGKDVFVDVETGVNAAISRVRQLLRDSADKPEFIETVAGKGYRFIAAVDVVATGSSGIRLAVLPFDNFGMSAEREYLSDGLVEETIALLGQMDPEHVRVIGRTSAAKYKGMRKSLAEIGAELNADYLVEGSIQSEGDQIRITSRLIRVGDELQVWSDSFDRHITSFIGVQRELSKAIAEQIRLRLSPERLSALAQRHSGNADAYDLYLRGRYFWNRLTPATNKRAIEYYERAIALDRSYALAWAGMAVVLIASPINSDTPPLQVLARAQEATARAIETGGNLVEVQNCLGILHFLLDWDWPASEAAFRKANALDPSDALAYMLGHVLSQMGQQQEAIECLSRACELDPLNAVKHAMASQVAFQAREFSRALESAKRAIVIDPEFWIGYIQLGQTYEVLGEYDKASEAFVNAARFSGNNSKAISFRGHLLAKSGHVEEARELLTMLEAVSRERYIPPYAIALVNAGLGERDAAINWLHHAAAARDVHLMFLPVDPKWDEYRENSRFKDVLAKCNFMHRG